MDDIKELVYREGFTESIVKYAPLQSKCILKYEDLNE